MMDTIKTNVNEDPANNTEDTSEVPENKLQSKIEDVLEKLRVQSMALGVQAICRVILDKINQFENAPGKKSCNDYKRIIKDISSFCNTGLSKKVETPHFDKEENTAQN